MEEELTNFKFSKKTVVSLVVLALFVLTIPLGLYLSQKTQIFRSRAAENKQQIDFYGKKVNFLKLFGQKSISETTRNQITGHKIYHASSVVVDISSQPNKVYVVDSGNNRILGFNGIGYCSNKSSQSCTIDNDCGSGNTCRVDGTKDADIVFGQADLSSGSCNRDDNLGFTKNPDASTLCLTGYPYANNIAESWLRDNIEVDNQGNLYVPDFWNNRILKFNQPFSQDKTGGKGDAVADFVWGQNDFTSNGINQHSPYYDSSARTPTNKSIWISFGFGTADNVSTRGVSADPQGNVWVADTFNNRVLRFPKDSQTADLVLGQPDFASVGCVPNGPLNRFCTPTLARIDPQSGDLYVLDEYPGEFHARILVFRAPFSIGMSAYKSIVVNQGPALWNGNYIFQSTGFTFNPYKEGEYTAGKLWINENSTERTVLTDGDGKVIKIIGALDNKNRGGDAQYGGACGNIYDPNQFYLWWPGGTIGFDSENNIYLADEFFNRISRYNLPYQTRTIGGKTCLPLPNGGLFKGTGVNTKSDNNLGESVGMVTYGNQLIVKDEASLKIWNDYLQKPLDSTPDIVLTGGMPSRILFSDAIDEKNRLWMYNEWGGIRAYQLPFKGGDTPLVDNVNLYWKDTGAAVNPALFETGLAVDKINKAIYIADRQNNRILRITNYNEFLDKTADKLYVDMVIGQPDKAGLQCNHGSTTPVADGLCTPYDLKFDRLGNLFVVENGYECHGNDRISIFSAEDLKNTQGLFPMLSAKKVLVANSLTEKGPCAYSTVNQPGSPVSLAFDSHNHLVVGNDGYYGDMQTRQLRQLWFYKDPLNKQIPDGHIDLPLGTPGEITFDSADNLFVQDHTWNKVWGINLNDDPAWGINTGILPTSTPNPSPLPTSIPTPVPSTSASFSLTSDKSQYTSGELVQVTVAVKSDTDAANLFAAKLKFPADLLQVNKIDLKSDSSFIKNWIEDDFDNSEGTVSLVGGLPNPGLQTHSGESNTLMAEITFVTKRTGTATISFNSDSAIYRNSDNENILGLKKEVSFQILPSITITPTSGPVPTISPFSWQINAEAVCSNGIKPVQKTRLFYALWPIGNLVWHNDNFAPGIHNRVISSTDPRNYIYVGLDGEGTGALKPSGTPPNPAISYITFFNPPTWGARWGRADLPAGIYNLKFQAPAAWCMSGKLGDINGDGKVDLVDLSTLLSRWNMSVNGQAVDLNGDGVVNTADYSLMLKVLVDAGIIKSS
ncbi:MAG: dockerin type I domain-containing protein [Patescibacteria group bacterium]|nr:dockerin type I domain-containing protein [Patescibacteria group bacterium]